METILELEHVDPRKNSFTEISAQSTARRIPYKEMSIDISQSSWLKAIVAAEEMDERREKEAKHEERPNYIS